MTACNLRSLLVAAIVLSNCITWTASRRHYTQHMHRTRHRRQGAGLFLSGSYVIPGGEGTGWGEWKDDSPCSRTCGGGVASQKRICLQIGPDGQPQCTGGDTKYFSCNTQDCPSDAGDFRAEQCSAYDDKDFRGFKYQWIPYTKTANPCELNCMPRGERFYYTHRPKVIDGTRCNEDSYDVCVEGVCQSVGCDRMLGSNAREDKCRQCRGNGSNCSTEKGILNRQDYVKGYNDLMLIPAGATTIIIEEIAPSNNYLALRNNNNTFYLNGHYHIDFPRSLIIAGALWNYERSQSGFPAPDKLKCLGPTNETLILSLLLQGDNVGVQYEYSLPSTSMPVTNQQYNWVTEDFSPCSAACGGGVQTRNVTCRLSEDLEVLDDILCDKQVKPVENQTCNSDPCPPEWVEEPWGECSKRCGSDGVRQRAVTCQQIIANGYPSLVADSECFKLHGKKPELFQECNRDAVCPKWFVGKWQGCSRLCDEGVQKRQVVCHQKTNGRVQILDDQECEEEKPAMEQPCMLTVCDGTDWVATEWSGCDTCLSKVATRQIVCATEMYQVVNDSFCEYHNRPVTEQPCDESKLPACEVQWYATQWSECSVDCGEGVQTRKVFCGLYEDGAVREVADEMCAAFPKYNGTKPCSVPVDKCPLKWFVGEWDECTVKCDGGEQHRHVMCLKGGKPASNCTISTSPDTTQACNLDPCNEDQLITVSTTVSDADYLPICDEEDDDYPEVGVEVEVGANGTTYEPEMSALFTEGSGEGSGETSTDDISSVTYDISDLNTTYSTSNDTDDTTEAGTTSNETVTTEAAATTNETVTTETGTTSNETATTESGSTSNETVITESGTTSNETVTTESATTSNETVTTELGTTSNETATTEAGTTSNETVTTESGSTSNETITTESGTTSNETVATESGTTSNESVTTESSTTSNETLTAGIVTTSNETVTTESGTTSNETVTTESGTTSNETVTTESSTTSNETVTTESDTTSNETDTTESGTTSNETVTTESGTTSNETVTTESGTTSNETLTTESGTTSNETVTTESGTTSNETVTTESGTTSNETVATETGTTSNETVTTESGTTSNETVTTESGTTSNETVTTESGTTSNETVTTESGTTSNETVTTESGTTSNETVTTESGTTSNETVTTESGTTSNETATTESGTTSNETVTTESGTTSNETVTTESGTTSNETVTTESGTTGNETITTESGTTSNETITTESDTTSNETVTTESGTTSNETVTTESGTTSNETETSTESITTIAESNATEAENITSTRSPLPVTTRRGGAITTAEGTTETTNTTEGNITTSLPTEVTSNDTDTVTTCIDKANTTNTDDTITTVPTTTIESNTKNTDYTNTTIPTTTTGSNTTNTDDTNTTMSANETETTSSDLSTMTAEAENVTSTRSPLPVTTRRGGAITTTEGTTETTDTTEGNITTSLPTEVTSDGTESSSPDTTATDTSTEHTTTSSMNTTGTNETVSTTITESDTTNTDETNITAGNVTSTRSPLPVTTLRGGAITTTEGTTETTNTTEGNITTSLPTELTSNGTESSSPDTTATDTSTEHTTTSSMNTTGTNETVSSTITESDTTNTDETNITAENVTSTRSPLPVTTLRGGAITTTEGTTETTNTTEGNITTSLPTEVISDGTESSSPDTTATDTSTEHTTTSSMNTTGTNETVTDTTNTNETNTTEAVTTSPDSTTVRAGMRSTRRGGSLTTTEESSTTVETSETTESAESTTAAVSSNETETTSSELSANTTEAVNTTSTRSTTPATTASLITTIEDTTASTITTEGNMTSSLDMTVSNDTETSSQGTTVTDTSTEPTITSTIGITTNAIISTINSESNTTYTDDTNITVTTITTETQSTYTNYTTHAYEANTTETATTSPDLLTTSSLEANATTITSSELSTNATETTSADLSTNETETTSADLSTNATETTPSDLSTNATETTSSGLSTNTTEELTTTSPELSTTLAGETTTVAESASTTVESLSTTEAVTTSGTEASSTTESETNATESATTDGGSTETEGISTTTSGATEGITSGSSGETTESGETTTTEEGTTPVVTTEGLTTTEAETTDRTTLAPGTTPRFVIKPTGLPMCRPRKKPVKCKFTKYGCCPDKKTPAKSPFDIGCPKPRTCKETPFGCCPDGVSPAKGENGKGCPVIPCEDTLFGCCLSDNKTAANGNDQEGCPPPPPACASSLYGCCPDNETEAAGPNGAGCGPETTTTEATTAAESTTTTASYETSTTIEGSTTIESSTTAEGNETSTTVSSNETSSTAGGSTDEGSTTVILTTTLLAGCAGSEFGCCHDNETAAPGPDGQGCPCNATKFGCCPDGVSPAYPKIAIVYDTAQGENGLGCQGPCKDSAYGCCPDDKTPAHGPEYEGCCLLTRFGCCPDNRKPAEGPHLEGCACQNSQHGCCPDKVTAATGPNYEGCGCQYTTYGCCPDRRTTALGPEFEGCSCQTYQFGCCPDGVSIPIGPDQQGCGCSFSEYGCCGDKKTPATGPNGAGCDCSSSEYGCCLDGVTPADGPKFHGCADVPENKQEACARPRDGGECRDYRVMWFYDVQYGGCTQFWYGGCGGNGNKFETKEDCEDICVQPAPKDACNLPGIKGPCDNQLIHWYYNSTEDQCKPFEYGGCLGNANNFDTEKQCQTQCQPERVADACELSIEEGPCAGNFSSWGFNTETKRCEQFIWGGCGGNTNRFKTEAACKMRCNPAATQCNEPQEAGNCTDKEALWSFSQTENRCMPFYYTGCGGNNNRFDSREICGETCPSSFERDKCTLPPEPGDCAEYRLQWFYDTAYKRCRQFYYGGCHGNENNFATEVECENACHEVVITTTTVRPTQPPQPVPQPQPENEQYAFCFYEIDQGAPCSAPQETRYAYDSALGKCVPFQYRGCAGNRNNFPDEAGCSYYCRPVQDVCQLPMVAGPCGDSVMAWFYDAGTDSCSQFTYSGCGGNENRFETRGACENRCRTGPEATTQRGLLVTTRSHDTVNIAIPECAVSPTLEECVSVGEVWFLDPETNDCVSHMNPGRGAECRHTGTFESQEACARSCGAFRGIDVCTQPVDAGPCSMFVAKVYFELETGSCKQFAYGGCLGGPNRFSSVSECLQTCLSHVDACKQPLEQGECGGHVPQYYYHETYGCMPFTYSGCGGNENRFETRQECENRCSRPAPSLTTTTTLAPAVVTRQPEPESECTTPRSLTPCGSNRTVYYYDSNSGRCLPSEFGNCGHPNSYPSEEACERQCGAFRGINVCHARLDTGPCGNRVPKYYFDSATGTCQQFTYSGCGGGPNRFSTIEECQDHCRDSGPAPRCLLEVDTGYTEGCRAPSVTRHHYSTSRADCIIFVYSGCGGNENNFPTYQECRRTCVPLEQTNEVGCETYERQCAALKCPYGVVRAPAPGDCERCACAAAPAEIDCEPYRQECDALVCPFGVGRVQQNGCERCICYDDPCSMANCASNQRCVATAHRDPATGEAKYTAICENVGPDCSAVIAECQQLQCEFGMNHVRTPEGCQRCECVRVEVNRCEAYRQECENMRCQNDIKRTVDSDGCERCTCPQEPCDGKICAEGERCVVNPYRDVMGETKYSAECRPVTKEGQCPIDDGTSDEGDCNDLCNDDADCRGVGKCCRRGCRNMCLAPATPGPPVVTTTYAPNVPAPPQAVPQREPNMTVTEGGKAVLRCLFHGNPPPRITWRFGELTIDGDVGRYRLTSEGALEIISLYRNDTGVYICVADNELGRATQEIHLVVNDPVNTNAGIAGDQNALVTGELYQPLSISCLAYGYPPPGIYWLHHGMMVPFNDDFYEIRGNTLLIRSLSIETLGQYTCQAYNGVGRAASWVVTVRAYQPVDYLLEHDYLVPRSRLVTTRAPARTTRPVVTTTTTTTTEQNVVFNVPVSTHVSTPYSSLKAGTELRIQCDVDGYPDPDVYWTKDGARIAPDDRISISGSAAVSRLVISRVAVSDSGLYGCHAQNSYSAAQDNAQINVQQSVLPAKCTDNPFFANCDLIVRSKFCNHKYYSKFCCKSCVEAGQLDPQVAEMQADQPYRRRK